MIRLVRDGIKAVLGKFVNIEADVSIKKAGQEVATETALAEKVDKAGSITQIATRLHSDLQGKNDETNVKHINDLQKFALDNSNSPSATNFYVVKNDIQVGYAEDEGESSTTSTSYIPKLSYSFIPNTPGNYIAEWTAELSTTAKDKDVYVAFAMGTTFLNRAGMRSSEAHSLGGDDGYTTFGSFVRVNLTSPTTFTISFRSRDGATVKIRRARIKIWRVLW